MTQKEKIEKAIEYVKNYSGDIFDYYSKLTKEEIEGIYAEFEQAMNEAEDPEDMIEVLNVLYAKS